MGTFGSSLDGSYGAADIVNVIRGLKATCPEACTVDKITIRMNIPWNAAHAFVKCALYDEVTDAFIANSGTDERDLGIESVPANFDFIYSGTAPTLAAQDYVICVWGGRAAGYISLLIDDNTSAGRYDAEAYNGFPDPLLPTDNTRGYCCQVTYTPSGGGLSIPVAMRHFRNLRTAITNVNHVKPTILRI